MQQLRLPSATEPLNILCFGAHSDDIDIGCGGSLLALLERHAANVTWVAFSGTSPRASELEASAKRFLRRAASKTTRVFDFRESFFPADYAQIKEAFESLKTLPRPDLIFTHHRADLHQDHRIVSELTWGAFRDHLILEYEIPKFDGGLTPPNAYVAVTKAQAQRKIDILLDCYATQRSKRWFTADTFWGLMSLRGIESGAPTGWAEGFHASKLLLG